MNTPEVIKTEDAAWAAGLFEGEGSVSSNGSCPSAHVAMTDLEPLEVMLSLFGGKINGPYRYGKSKKNVWRWSIHGWEKVDTLRLSIFTRLSPRRLTQFSTVLDKKPRRLLVTRPKPCNSPSYTGYGKHYRSGETPCAPCREMALAYRRNWENKGVSHET